MVTIFTYDIQTIQKITSALSYVILVLHFHCKYIVSVSVTGNHFEAIN